MTEKQYIRARVEVAETECRRCGAKIVKNSPKQIVYFCSRECRNDKSKPTFRFVKE